MIEFFDWSIFIYQQSALQRAILHQPRHHPQLHQQNHPQKGCEEVPAQNYSCVASSPDYSGNSKVPIGEVEWNVKFLFSIFDVFNNQTSFIYEVSVDSFKPGTGGSPGEELRYWILGIEKCAQISFFSERSFFNNGTDIGDNSNFNNLPAEVDSETCVNGVNFNISYSAGTFGSYVVTLKGNITKGPVSYAVVGSSRFAIGSTTGPNCECQPDEDIIIPEWSPWSSWGGCDFASCGQLGIQTRSRSCSNDALQYGIGSEFCAGTDEQFRECSLDEVLCTNITESNCVIPNTTLSDCSNQCSYTCLTFASPDICNDDESECTSGCVCEHGLVFDSSSGSCVLPEACACYDPVCNVHFENGTTNSSTCCPERQCSCENGTLNCEGNCPVDCVATEWSEWTSCDSQCIRSRSRCILVHGDFGGRECDGGEYQDEECDHDTDRCAACFYNGVEYRSNDVIESTQCYQTLCVDNATRVELRCDQGPSSANHCGVDEIYVPPSNETEAASQNCCGRCEKKACRSEDVSITLNITKQGGDYCGERNITVQKCVGSCGASYAMAFPNDDLYVNVLDTDPIVWPTEQNCKCCTGDQVHNKRYVTCDDVSSTYVLVPTMTKCDCYICAGVTT